MRQRLADDTDDDDDVIREESEERAVPQERQTVAPTERSAAAEQKRARKEVLDALAERRGLGKAPDSSESAGEEEEGSRRRARKRPTSVDGLEEQDRGGRGQRRPNGAEGGVEGRQRDWRAGPESEEERPDQSNGSELGAEGTGAASKDDPPAEEREDAQGKESGKRRRLLKTNIAAETGEPDGSQETLIDDFEALAPREPARKKRQVVIESDDDE